MVAAFFLHLSTTSTTNEVGMKGVWAGLVEVFNMGQINLLKGCIILERKSGSATITSQGNNDCNVVYLSDEREQACSFRSSVRDPLSDIRLSNVPTAHSNMGGDDNEVATRPVIRVCSSVSCEVQHGPQS